MAVRLRRAVALASLVLALSAAPGGAVPGDPPIVVRAPADGAAVAGDPDGIVVRFTCETYRSFPSSANTVYGDHNDYHALFATRPDVDANGKLLSANVVSDAAATRVSENPDTCTAAMASADTPKPQLTPGTYYWQAARSCVACPGGSEVSPVRRFTVRVQLTLAVVAQPIVYAGYPTVVGVRAGGLPERTAVAIDLDGKPVAAATVFGGRGETAVTLPLGRHRLTAHAALGNQQAASAARAIVVAPARAWQTSTRDDGRYTGTAEGGPVTSRVAGGGRRLGAYSARVSMFCVGASIDQNHILLGFALVSRVKIAPDGRFVAVANPGAKTTVRLQGRLRAGRVTEGRVELTVGTCSGSASFAARRTGPA
jgi:hypothetical protein